MKYPFILSWLKLDQALFLQEVTSFEEYIKNSEKSIKTMQDEFDKWWEDLIKENPEEKDELNMAYEDDIHRTFELMPHIAISSLYISISSLYENAIKKAAKTVRHEEIDLKWKDMSGGSDFDKVRLFLRKVGLIDLTPIDPAWQKVKQFYKLRNRIVHHNSTVELDKDHNIADKEIQHLFNQYASSLRIRTQGEFYFEDNKILHEYLKAVQEFITGLYKLLENRLIAIQEKKEKATGK